MTDSQHYAVRHPDGRWLYYLPMAPQFRHCTRTAVLADDKPMQPLNEGRDNWWVTDRQATRLTAVYRPRPKTVGYRLTDPSARSERFPEHLSPEEMRQARLSGGRLDAYDELYEALHEEQEDQEHTYEGRTVVLTGGEPPVDGLPWVANLPDSLVQHPEYRHCFPGYIPGLRSHLTSLIKPMSHVTSCLNGRSEKPEGLHVTISVPFDKPVSRWRPNLGSRGQALKSGRDVPVLATHEMYLPVSDRVSGPDYHTALTEWHAQVAFWTDLVRSASVRACNTCQGTGHVLDAPDPAR
ncbi:hypothetical protein ACIG3E_33660 [Streptomyces sp. NPDC053474]|uniref:hypothetical protein n=1 Tax=Streptomyces sp. NPDC053474 TaxID=3365704 RepID=UPI0037D90404